MHKCNEPSFFLTNSTRDLQGKLEGLIIPVFVFSSINSQRVCNSIVDNEYIGLREGKDPFSIWIDKS